MLDYECLFSNHLYEKLKGVIKGGIFVKVNENDSLVVEIKRKDGNNFGVSFTGFFQIEYLMASQQSMRFMR